MSARFSSGLLAVAALAGCASGGQRGAAAETRDVSITIVNNATGASQATIILEPQSGALRTLGVVEAGRTAVFPVMMQVGSYELIARTVAGDRGIPFSLFSNTMCVTWDMSANRITQRANCPPAPIRAALPVRH